MAHENTFLLGIFEDEHDMIHAAEELGKAKVAIHDIYTPFPVHGLDQVLGIKRTRLPYVTMIAGTFGLAFALFFQYWVSVIDWPINVGGKPFNSFAAFIPVAFEITILFGAFITVFSFFYRSKLIPFLSKGVHLQASQDRFVIALSLNDATLDVKSMTKLLTHHNAEVEIKKV